MWYSENIKHSPTVCSGYDYRKWGRRGMKRAKTVLICSGLVTLAVTIMWAVAFSTNVVGGGAAIAGVGVLAALYIAVMLSGRNKRSREACTNTFLGLFAALSISGILSMLIFFPDGDYKNYGMAGVYLFAATFVVPMVVSGIVVVNVNKMRTK